VGETGPAGYAAGPTGVGLAVPAAGSFARAAIRAWVANQGCPRSSKPVITRRSIRST
jgi:hypothetical protein